MRILSRVVAGVLLVTFAGALRAADPGPSIASAREHLKRQEYAAAVEKLNEALRATDSIPTVKQRMPPMAAIFFYRAVALSALGKAEEARSDLRSLFIATPGATLETGKYPRQFEDLFTRARKDALRGFVDHGPFDDVYRGYEEFARPAEPPANALWGASTAFLLAGTSEEKDEWASLADDAARSAFVEKFWSRRDPDPSTPENEIRAELLRRIDFADHVFHQPELERGSLSDRGRVFILVGKPFYIDIRPLTRTEAIFAPHRRGAGEGAMEQWTYRKENLPEAIPFHEVVFKFAAEAGSDVRILHRESNPMMVMGAGEAKLRPRATAN